MSRPGRLLAALCAVMMLALAVLRLPAAEAAPARPTPRPRPTSPARPTPQRTPVATPVKAADPTAALGACATDIFGVSMRYTKTGGLTSTVARTLSVPTESRGTVSATIDAGATAVYGLASNGLQTLSYGSGSVEDVSLSVSQASLCYLQLNASAAKPASADEALALLKQTFPGVPQDAEYAAKTVTGGYSFSLTTKRAARDGTVSAQKIVLIAVAGPKKGQLWLGATSGIGTFAALV